MGKRAGRTIIPTLYVDGEQFIGFTNNRTRIIRALGVDPPGVH